jgi:hypothetical protein
MIRGRRSGILIASGRDRTGSKKFPNLFDRVPSTGIMSEEPNGLRGIALVIERPWGSKVADYIADAIDLTIMCAEVGEQHLLEACRQIGGGGPVGGCLETPRRVKIEMSLKAVSAVNDRGRSDRKTGENFQRLPLAFGIPALRTFRVRKVDVRE